LFDQETSELGFHGQPASERIVSQKAMGFIQKTTIAEKVIGEGGINECETRYGTK
jgi:hypothetical protein